MNINLCLLLTMQLDGQYSFTNVKASLTGNGNLYNIYLYNIFRKVPETYIYIIATRYCLEIAKSEEARSILKKKSVKITVSTVT